MSAYQPYEVSLQKHQFNKISNATYCLHFIRHGRTESISHRWLFAKMLPSTDVTLYCIIDFLCI